VLAPGDPPEFASIDVPEPIPYDQVLMIAWTDADGKHGPESTGIHPPRYANGSWPIRGPNVRNVGHAAKPNICQSPGGVM
jgi:hypothetical protein